MRKKIRLLIALFTLGQAAMAQSLNSGEQLKQKESFPKMPPKTALVKADAAATPYWVDAKSYYDANRSYSREDGYLDSYRADLTFNGDKVTITNLVNLGEFQVTSTSPIEEPTILPLKLSPSTRLGMILSVPWPIMPTMAIVPILAMIAPSCFLRAISRRSPIKTASTAWRQQTSWSST